jgi:hypothetical protein
MRCSGPGIFGNCLFQSVAHNIFGLLAAIIDLYQLVVMVNTHLCNMCLDGQHVEWH